MNNHLMALTHLTENGTSEEIKNYLLSMRQDLSQIGEDVITTGHPLIDIISSYYRKILPESNMLHITGNLSESLPVDNYHLTVIYSNLLQNAVEALMSDNRNDVDKRIDVSFHVGKFSFELRISNTYAETTEKYYVSRTNSDKDHGYGLSNVRRIIAELNGNYVTSAVDGIYTAIVQIKAHDS